MVIVVMEVMVIKVIKVVIDDGDGLYLTGRGYI